MICQCQISSPPLSLSIIQGIMGTQHSLKETDTTVIRIAIDHIYHKTFRLLGMKCLMQCAGQHGNGPVRKNQQLVSPWHSFRLHQLNILHQSTTLMVGPTSLWRGLVQYAAVGTEWEASSDTNPSDHVNSLWPQHLTTQNSISVRLKVWESNNSTSGKINVYRSQNQQIYNIWL
jgi:hypothetical protein